MGTSRFSTMPGGGYTPDPNYGSSGGDFNFGGSGFSDIGQGLGGIFSGLFGHSDRPYKEAGNTLKDYLGQATATQNPFMKMGTNAIPQQQEWLQGQKDPSGFINNLMGKYSESPWAKFQQEQSARRFGNAGSASGLTGSTALGQFEQQNAHDISQQDMQQWLSNVLGINTQYGAGLQNEITGGQSAANSISELLRSMGTNIAGNEYDQAAAKNRDRNDLWGGIFQTAGGAAKAYAGM